VLAVRHRHGLLPMTEIDLWPAFALIGVCASLILAFILIP
jgi:hypothetical protein